MLRPHGGGHLPGRWDGAVVTTESVLEMLVEQMVSMTAQGYHPAAALEMIVEQMVESGCPAQDWQRLVSVVLAHR